ncbi:hypothetical protein ACFO4N_13530 [Camelliibacillus cellulosilyticus]|uniref:YfhD-like protein n=1 Tax=Camelliibacillus cellulosilyticus TaxID=2174486 RepID=A0ABV9GND5_9BACL
MAEKEKLNEEAAPNNRTPPSATVDDLVTLNQINDRNKQLPRAEKRLSINKELKRGYID